MFKPFKHCPHELCGRVILYIILRKTGRKLPVVVPFLKIFIFGKYLSSTDTLKPTLVHKPVAKFSDSYGVVGTMCLDVATG